MREGTNMAGIDEARTEAEAILKLDQESLGKLFFSKTMKRNLSRTVRHLDKLVASGGEDRKLGAAALNRLGFPVET